MLTRAIFKFLSMAFLVLFASSAMGESSSLLSSPEVLDFLILSEQNHPGVFDGGHIGDAAAALLKQNEIIQNGSAVKQDRRRQLIISNNIENTEATSPVYLNLDKVKDFLLANSMFYQLSEVDLSQKITELSFLIKNKNSQAVLTGLAKSAHLNLALFFNLPLEKQIELLEKNLPTQPSSKGFLTSSLALPEAASSNEIISELKKLKSYENEIILMALIFQFKFEKEFKFESKALKLRFQKEKSQFEEVISMKFASTPQKIELKEMPLNMALLRGCIGGDCSTKKSFAYPNLETEKVMFIYVDGEIKGYLQFTKVVTSRAPAIYLHTISGDHISFELTLQLVELMQNSISKLGVKSLILPEQEKILSLINYKVIRNALLDIIQKGEKRSFEYVDHAMRSQLHSYVVDSRFDSAEYTKRGILYVGQSDINREIAVVAALWPSMQIRKISDAERKIFLLKHFSKNLVEDLTKVDLLLSSLPQPFIESARGLALKLSNPLRLSWGEYQKEVRNIVAAIGEFNDFDQILTEIRGPVLRGLLNCSDFGNIDIGTEIISKLRLISPTILKKEISYSEVAPFIQSYLTNGAVKDSHWIPAEYLQMFLIEHASTNLDINKIASIKTKLMKNTDTVYQRYLTRTYLSLLSIPGLPEKDILEITELFVQRIQLHSFDFIRLLWGKSFWNRPGIKEKVDSLLDQAISQRPSLSTALNQAFKENLKPLQLWLSNRQVVRSSVGLAGSMKKSSTVDFPISCQQIFKAGNL